MSKILTTHKDRLAAYRHLVMAPVENESEQAANHKQAVFEYREGLADDVEKIIESFDIVRTTEKFRVRELATEIARYVTGEH